MSYKLGISSFVVNEAIEELVEARELVYTYRDPDSFVEIPCNGCDGPHRAARPMEVVVDDNGNRWLCDDAKRTSLIPGQVCWDCGSLSFTRSG